VSGAAPLNQSKPRRSAFVNATDETLEINRLTARGVLAIIAKAPGFYARVIRHSALLLSGERVADLNLLLVGPDVEPEQFLNDAIEIVRQRRLPLLAALMPHVAITLAPAARRLGFSPSGVLPMMVLRTSTPFQLGRACEVQPVGDDRTNEIAGELQASAFAIPRDSIARAFDASRVGITGVETFIGSFDGVPVTTMTVVRTGPVAGIWLMATHPDRQRRGAGRALLSNVLELYRQQGVVSFYLNASESGLRLYRSLGFETIAEYSLWLMPPPS
jgi:GNAT superfamily N-acetyltransferase